MILKTEISKIQKRIALLELGLHLTEINNNIEDKSDKIKKYISRIDFNYSRMQHKIELIKTELSYKKRNLCK